jgi:hypothetical protein
VHPNRGRCKAQCNTPPCNYKNLGTFDTPEDAAQSYLQHNQKKHPEELKQERAPPSVLPEVQHHLLIRSDRGKTGYKGVVAQYGRYRANCATLPCRSNHLDTFDTPEDAAQAYLQHHQEEHEHVAELKDVKPLAEEEEEDGGHAVSTDKGKKRKQQPQPTPESGKDSKKAKKAKKKANIDGSSPAYSAAAGGGSRRMKQVTDDEL